MTEAGISAVRFLLFLEGSAFSLASVIHSGRLVQGYAHLAARNAEAVIAMVLLAALVLTWIRPRWFRRIGLLAQAFALAGTMVGVFTIIVGVGPRTTPDVIYHVVIILLLAWGLRFSSRLPTEALRGPH
jgi:steroid 5-alpha reductase family enzyme